MSAFFVKNLYGGAMPQNIIAVKIAQSAVLATPINATRKRDIMGMLLKSYVKSIQLTKCKFCKTINTSSKKVVCFLFPKLIINNYVDTSLET